MNRTQFCIIILAIFAATGTARAQSFFGVENPQHNESLGLDVDNDGQISPRDLLLIVDKLSTPASSQALPLLAVASPLATTPSVELFYDTNNDQIFSPGDALVLVDHFSVSATAPEPSSLLTAGIGLSLFAGYALRRRRKGA